MEQQKALWIVFSVALFLLVIVVVGFIWFLPADNSPVASAAEIAAISGDSVGEGDYDPIEWVRETSVVPGIEMEEGAQTEEDILLVYGETADDPLETEKGDSQENVVALVRVSDPAPPVTPAIVAPTIKKVTPAVRPAATEKPKTVRVTQYWIQAGSFKSRSRAEDSQRSLSEKGWNARIISRDVHDETFFRVRLGPYPNAPEAQKFLDWLREIDSYEASYISQVYTTQNLN